MIRFSSSFQTRNKEVLVEFHHGIVTNIVTFLCQFDAAKLSAIIFFCEISMLKEASFSFNSDLKPESNPVSFLEFWIKVFQIEIPLHEK